jgi:hypothetical protein
LEKGHGDAEPAFISTSKGLLSSTVFSYSLKSIKLKII